MKISTKSGSGRPTYFPSCTMKQKPAVKVSKRSLSSISRYDNFSTEKRYFSRRSVSSLNSGVFPSLKLFRLNNYLKFVWGATIFVLGSALFARLRAGITRMIETLTSNFFGGYRRKRDRRTNFCAWTDRTTRSYVGQASQI